MTNCPISEKAKIAGLGGEGSYFLLFLLYAHGLGWSAIHVKGRRLSPVLGPAR
jgi:hypothetical protein